MKVRAFIHSARIKPTWATQLEQVKHALARAAFTLCWLPSIALSLVNWFTGKSSLPLLLFFSLLLWYFLEYFVPRKQGNVVSILLAMAILYVPVLEQGTHPQNWFVVNLSGVATVVLAALYTSWPISLVFIGISALIEHFVIVSQINTLGTSDIYWINGWVTPMWIFLLGAFVGFAFHGLKETFAQEDRITESMETLKARDAIMRALAEEHSSQRRRLHETVLNTLATLVRKNTGGTETLLNRLRSEIAEARFYQGLVAPTSMSAIIGSVVPTLATGDPSVDIKKGEDILLPQKIARDVRDALAELILNAIRHSGGSHVHISWERRQKNLVIRVIDDGVGLSQKSSKGLGLGQILPEILADRRARMTTTSGEGTGTQIELIVPLEEEEDRPAISHTPPHSLFEMFDSVGRILLAAPALAVAGLSWWLIAPYSPKPILIGLLALHVVALLVASVNPRRKGAWTLIVVGLFAGLSIVLLISHSANACQNIGQLRWAANFLCISTSIAAVFYVPRRLRLFFMAITIIALYLMGLLLPDACSGALLTPASALFGFFLVLITLWRQTNRWRDNLQVSKARSAELTRRRIERKIDVDRAEQWFAAMGYLDRFARSASTGLIAESDLQKQAHIEEARLRARIQIDPFITGGFAQLALALVNVAAKANWTPTIAVVEALTDSDPVSPDVHLALCEAFAGSETGMCQITLYLDEDEECLTVVSSCLDLQRAAVAIGSGLRNGVERTRAVFDSVNGEHWLEIRRGIQALKSKL
jgi:signal transduction histidine kinase